MKKSLVALAVLAASGAAMAQSSVTLYGVVDVALSDTSASGSTAQMSGSGGMNNGTSRFGFRGTEDLGGGLKANFNMEGGFNPETGAGNLSGGNLFSRAANLSLAGNFGTLKMGRTLSTSFYGIAAWEITGTANYSVVASQFGFAGMDSRQSSQFSYTTPNMGGLSAELGYVFKADNAGHAKTDLNVIYAKGPIAAGLSYNKTQHSEKNWALGGKYDFGTFQVAASYQDPAGARKGFTVGGSAALGPVALTLDVARDTGSVKKSTDTVIEAKYALSKRTFAYGAAQRDGSAGVTAYGLGIRHNF